MKYRIEKDSLGELQVPAEVYYGIQTLRAKNNFDITKRPICRQLIKALAIVKKACAKANMDAGMIDEKIAKAIMLSCDEILNGRLHGQFVTDLIQGGAGTSINMNANEVLANRANEMLGGKRGTYDIVHPLDHVNFGQSTNDVIPTAGKIAMVKQIKKTIVELKKLQNVLLDKAKEFDNVTKLGRTHLQEAIPIRLGQEFHAYASALARDIKRMDDAIESLLEINLGATAIGTGLNANTKYAKKVVSNIAKMSGEDFKPAKDLIDSTRNLACFSFVSSCIKITILNLSKAASDLRLMSSYNEINLPAVQPGSTIMPGKVNPVIPEVVNQVAFYIQGLDVTISSAVEGGQLELNVFEPIILMSLFEEITSLRRATRSFRDSCIVNITCNKAQCEQEVEQSLLLVTALSPHLGFETSCSLVDEAMEKEMNIKDLVLSKGLLNKEAIDEILNPENMTSPGILGEEFLEQKEK